MTTTLSVKEDAQKYGVSVETVRRRIRSGKLQADFDGHQYRVHDNPQQSTTSSQQHLREKISYLEEQVEQLKQQLSETDEQIAELHQLLAISQKNVDRVTEQNQLLLEDLRPKQRWYHRLLVWNNASAVLSVNPKPSEPTFD
jgi:excisionase family DNA binding protein